MTGHEIDALFGFALLVTIELRTTENSGLPSSRSAMRPTEPSSPRKKPRIITKPPVPFPPTWDEYVGESAQKNKNEEGAKLLQQLASTASVNSQ